jgi:signal transduction histidine kinase/DNA-binding NarL/FixJ family response regulator
MKKTGTERNIILLAIFIVLAVGISGFLVYQSLTQIVNSIHKEASSDFTLIVIKDISLDLLEIENSVELYTLTKSKTNLENYEKVNKRLKETIKILSGQKNENAEDTQLIDSVSYLAETKLEIWKEIKQINVVKNDPQPQFDELYSMLEKKEIDTIEVKVTIEPEKKKGLLKKIFAKKDTAVTRIDTSYVEKTVENEEIKEEIEALETGLKQQEQRKNRHELELIEQNIQLTGKLNHLIAQIEKTERDNLIEKNDEADRLATIIYKRLSAFSVMAVIMLFVVLLLFLRYLLKEGKVQKALIAAKSGAEKLAKAKEVFMANVSHEMRTPVNAIYGLTEQLLQENTSKNVNEKLGILLRSAEHLKEVVNDTLDFSKIQVNKLKIKEIDFSPENIISEILSLHKSEALAKHIDLTYSCSDPLPVALLGDPFRLKQILINIIGNAIKFTEKGSVSIVVSSKSITNKFFHLSFQINDTGIGISTENLELIFEDFVQIESDYTRKFGGTGLGLSIVKKLIELQKGKISIKSEFDKGTNVSFYIPYKIGTPENIEKPKQLNITIPEKVKSLKILGVDDDEYNRYLLKIIFEKWGVVNYYEAQNGNEAVKLALEIDFDLIFMDLRMPDISGIEASKLINKEKPNSNIVVLATITSEAEIKMCEEAGMRNFLSKPFAEAELLDTIVTVLKIDGEDTPESEDFELKELERLTNGDRVFMKEMILVFIRSSETSIKNMKLAIESENWQGISEEAHKMSAPCKHIKADDLYNSLKQLEKYAGNLEAIQRIPELILSIEKKVEKINAALLALIESETFNLNDSVESLSE